MLGVETVGATNMGRRAGLTLLVMVVMLVAPCGIALAQDKERPLELLNRDREMVFRYKNGEFRVETVFSRRLDPKIHSFTYAIEDVSSDKYLMQEQKVVPSSDWGRPGQSDEVHGWIYVFEYRADPEARRPKLDPEMTYVLILTVKYSNDPEVAALTDRGTIPPYQDSGLWARIESAANPVTWAVHIIGWVLVATHTFICTVIVEATLDEGARKHGGNCASS